MRRLATALRGGPAWRGGVAPRLAIACALVLAGATGCGKKATTAPSGSDALPPEILEVFPASRSTRVSLRTAIWVRFREPLDPATVSTTTVFLKVDTRRVPITVTLADSNRRIELVPQRLLGLRQTHTIELTPAIRTTSGARLASTYFWQFTTLSVRAIDETEPGDGSVAQSPFTTLFWNASDPAAGTIEYRLYVGADSAAVANAAVPVITLATPYYVPPSRWPLGTSFFWKVEVINRDTGDEASGTVRRFDTVAPGTPIDSIIVRILDSGYWDNPARTWRCPALVSGANFGGLIRFDFRPIDSTLVVAAARMQLGTSTSIGPNHSPQLWATPRNLAPCDPGSPGIPAVVPNGFLGIGVRDPDARIRFESDLLTAHVQARIQRHPEFQGYALRSQLNVTYVPFDPVSVITVHYYRTGAAAPGRRSAARR